MRIYLFFLLLTTLFTACESDFIYEKETEFPNASWTHSDSLTYQFNIEDTSIPYNLYLDLTHTNQFPFQNLYTMIHTTYPSGRRVDSRISIDLADKLGEWYGKCNSESCRLRVNLQQNTLFKEKGEHTITFEQYMRRDSLKGVEKFGFLIEKGNKQEKL